jgi:nicotinamide-nucleotide amidase
MPHASDQERERRSVPDADQLHAAAQTLLEQLERADMTLATAESCTGGFLSSLLTDIEGLSHCVDRGYVTYSDTAKQDMLAIDAALINEHGAVSEPVARSMAENSLKLAGAGLSLAVTGFAGASEPDEIEGPGVTYIGVAVADQSWVYRVDYGERPRRDVRNLATFAALSIGTRTLAGRDR